MNSFFPVGGEAHFWAIKMQKKTEAWLEEISHIHYINIGTKGFSKKC